MFPVRKKGPTKNRMAAKINQVICNSRSFKVTNIRPARKSAELVRRQHAWGAIACYPRRRRPNSAFSAIAVAADCSERADSNRTLWGAALGTSWDFHPKMICLLFFALVLPFHLCEAYTVRPGRCPEYVMGESTYRTCRINPIERPRNFASDLPQQYIFPLFSGMTNFDKTSYLGEWYEYANVFEFYQDLPCKCDKTSISQIFDMDAIWWKLSC